MPARRKHPGAAGAEGARRTALLLSGTGRYSDPWHPFADTSRHLSTLAGEEGLDVSQPEDVDGALSECAAGPLPDLVIANLGQPVDGAPSPARGAARRGIDRLLRHRPLLAVHSAASSFPDSAVWTRAVGARWIDGRSWHPERGSLTATAASSDSPIGQLASFTTVDERYLDLQKEARKRVVLFTHDDDDGRAHPSIWLRSRRGVRSAYVAYGHDGESYASPEHADVMRRLLRWLLAAR
jgi:hypothetical protein